MTTRVYVAPSFGPLMFWSECSSYTLQHHVRWALRRRARDAEQHQAEPSTADSDTQPVDSDTAGLYRHQDLSLKARPFEAGRRW